MITVPLGTVSLLAVVTVPTVKPAAIRAVWALLCVKPTTLGTVVPSDTTNATALPGFTVVPAPGF